MKPMTLRVAAAVFVSVFLLSTQANANPIDGIGVGNFSGSETLVDLNSLPGNISSLTTQFSGVGLDFSTTGGGWIHEPETGFIVSGNASNIIARSVVGFATVELGFLTSMTRVGFDVGSNIDLVVTISILRNSNVTGSFTYAQSHNFSSFTPVFRGFEDSAEIDGVRLAFTSGVHFIDNIRFENTQTVIPEPSTLLLLGSGLAGLAAWRRKKAA